MNQDIGQQDFILCYFAFSRMSGTNWFTLQAFPGVSRFLVAKTGSLTVQLVLFMKSSVSERLRKEKPEDLRRKHLVLSAAVIKLACLIMFISIS